MMWKTLTAILLLIFIAYSEGGEGACPISKFERVPAPTTLKYHHNPTNGSLNFKNCGTGPDIVYSVIPEKVTAETSSFLINLKLQALADSDGGFASADLEIAQFLPPVRFSCGYDCDLFEDYGLKCALPFKKGAWYEMTAKCSTFFFMPNMKANVKKAKIVNYDDEIVFCFELTFRAF